MLESLVVRYGLPAAFAGAILEGETVVVLAGFAAHRGYLDLSSVLVVAWIGTILGDEFWFWLGRKRGRRFLAAHAHWDRRVEAVRPWIAKHERAVIWSHRFIYGIRTIAPFVLGMGGTSPLRFAILNAASASVWTGLVGGLGYLLGTVLGRLLGELRMIEGLLFAAIVGVGALVWLWHVRRLRRRGAEPG